MFTQRMFISAEKKAGKLAKRYVDAMYDPENNKGVGRSLQSYKRKNGDNKLLFNKIGQEMDRRMYSMTPEERAFCEGYEYAQREFGLGKKLHRFGQTIRAKFDNTYASPADMKRNLEHSRKLMQRSVDSSDDYRYANRQLLRQVNNWEENRNPDNIDSVTYPKDLAKASIDYYDDPRDIRERVRDAEDLSTAKRNIIKYGMKGCGRELVRDVVNNPRNGNLSTKQHKDNFIKKNFHKDFDNRMSKSDYQNLRTVIK